MKPIIVLFDPNRVAVSALSQFPNAAIIIPVVGGDFDKAVRIIQPWLEPRPWWRFWR